MSNESQRAECRVRKHHWLRIGGLILLLCSFASLRAQTNDTIHIATIRPDIAAPGMNVVMEILARDSLRPFGIDGLTSGSEIILVHPQDSNRIVVGPIEVSWNGRLLQVPIFVLPGAALGPVPFLVHSIIAGRYSDTILLSIDTPQHLGTLTGNVTIGNGVGQLSRENILLVDSLIATNATIQFSEQNIDTFPSNSRLLPVVILSKGPVRLTNSTISVDASGVNGGPGGGGGGHGFAGSGGVGYTGGGSCPSDSLGNNGSDSLATFAAGGRAATGIPGGGSDPDDQGGGGGTGAPYGLSGGAGVASAPSRDGGFGGGAGGGELTSPSVIFEYGGGGGGFGTNGFGGGQSFDIGANGGNVNNGRFLIPLAGGSGGGAGNSDRSDTNTMGGSGGGGGGALEIVAFDTMILSNANLMAQGDSGTSGVKIAAGGGGGSGGSLYLAALRGIGANQTRLSVGGGFGGGGALNGFPGGNGGLGRVRIDGPSNLTPGLVLFPVWTEGISLAPVSQVGAFGYIHIGGVSPDTNNTIDTVKIYYWTRHSPMKVIDTVRSADGLWSKWLPLPHDSLLFAVAMAEVFDPASSASTYDYEPPWLISNVSIGIIRHPASPFLVSVDTLDFGNVRVGGCKTLLLRVANEGGAPLVLNGGTVSVSSQFSISPDTTITIPPYQSDTLKVKYCPTVAGQVVATLSFRSNDSTNLPRIITLIGNGTAVHDSLVFNPESILFSRVLLDSCANDTVSLLSNGHDTLFLSQRLWQQLPFSIRLVPPDTVLDSGATAKLFVTFCPTDTGMFHYSPVLDGRGDTLSIVGRGVLRNAISTRFDSLGTLCLGQDALVFDTIKNIGNDTISILSVGGRHIREQVVGELLEPDTSLVIPVMVAADTIGGFRDTLSIQLAGSTLSTIVTYNVAGVSLNFDRSSIPFDFVCIGDSALRSLRITSIGPDTLKFSHFALGPAPSFSILDSFASLKPGSSDSLLFIFHPQTQDTVPQVAILSFIASDNGCDSEFAIHVSGTGLDSGLAAEKLVFDSVLLGKCKVDSLVVGNPCGPSAILDSAIMSNKDFEIVSPLPDTILSPDGDRLAIQFCPSTQGIETDSITLVLNSSKRIGGSISGIGYLRANPWAHFTVSRTSVPLDTEAVTLIRFDSSSLTGKHSVKAVVTFDPTVLSLASSFPAPVTPSGMDSETFYESFDFAQPANIELLTWNTLAGPRNFSPVNLYVIGVDTFVNAIVQNGSVTVTDCHGLAGQFASVGDYALGTVVPNPASEAATVTMQLGADAFVQAAIYDMTGRLVETLLHQDFKGGSYRLTIPTSVLASGHYLLEVNSMGWHVVTPFVVDR